MDNLYDVCSCLTGMDASKATERKKNAAQLEQLLGRDSITEIIDSNTARGTENRAVTWDVIFKGVNRYIDVEIAALQLAKQSQSATTLNNRDKKKQELTALFKLVLRSANKGNVKLSFQLLIDRIENMLKDAYTLEAFGTDYSRLFLKYVLRVRPYWLKISPEKWKKLTRLFFQLYDDSNMDKGILAEIIQDLMNGSGLQCQLNPRRSFSFYTRFFKDIRNLRDTSVIESILTSLNNFCKTVAPNSRVQLCYFGESQMNEFLSLWARPTDKIKAELVEFFHLLVRVHHPDGATDLCTGAYAHNWELWKKHVTFLHEIIVTDIDKVTDRYKFISRSKDFSPAYIAFAADVFKQMPVDKLVTQDFVVPLSQASQCGYHGDGAGPAKRKRLSPESKSLIEIVNDRSNTLQAIPWLQVLHQLLNKYPASFGERGLTTTLQVLTVLLAECKKGQLFQFLFEVLSVWIKAVQHFDGLKGKVAGLMTTVWSHCASTINSRQAEVEGYQEHGFHAMASMISSGLVSPTKEIWNLFLPTFSRPSNTADQLLTSLINTQGLLENYIPSFIGAPLGNKLIGKCQAYPLRQSLITWLLPVVDADSGSQLKTAISPSRSAEILYALILQDPSIIHNDLACSATSSTSSENSVLETTYLKSMFHHQSFKQRAKCLQSLCQGKECQRNNPQIAVVLEFLLKRLTILASNLDQQTSDFLTWLGCLLARLLYYLWDENATTTQLQSILNRVLVKIADSLVSQIQKELSPGLSANLVLLGASLTWEEEKNNRMFLVAEFVRSCLPGSFVDLLLDVASGKQVNKKANSNTDFSRATLVHSSSFSNRKETASTSRADVDLGFEMFDAVPSSSLAHSNGSGKDFGDENSLNDAEDASLVTIGINDFLRKENLTENGQLCVLCAEVLCRLTSYDRSRIDEPDDSLVIKTERDSDYINSRLLQLISSECFDPSQVLHVHLLLTISKHFLTCDHKVSLKDIKNILTAFKQTAKELVDDQQVCCRILSHLRYIIPHLCDHSDAASQQFCRDVYLKFVSDFWRLSSDSTPRLKYEIAETLLDLLKYDPDCTWGHLQIHTTDQQLPGFSLYSVATHFPKLLSDGSIVLRTFVAESLKWLFVRPDSRGGEIFRDKTAQKKAFESVFELCSELLDIEKGNLIEQRWQDELHNRQSTCLQALLTIIITSPVCEKQCLLGLYQILAERKIPLEPVRKMLSIICQELKFADIQSYLTCHLPYLTHNWLHQKMVNLPISQFPYELLGYDSQEQFVRSHRDLIISELLATKLSIAEVRTLLDQINMKTDEAFVSALPHMLTHILPAFAMNLNEDVEASGSHSWSHSRREFVKATDYITIVVSELSTKIIKEITYEKLGDIIVKILNCLSIEKDLTRSNLLCMVYPECNPPHYSHDSIQRTLDYLAQSFLTSDKDTTLITVLAKTQDGFYQVLLSLSSLLWREHRAHEQQRILQMYGLFVRMLLKELAGGLGGGWAAILRDMVNRLLIILTDRSHPAVSISSPSYDEEVLLTALNILQTVCTTALQTCPEEISNYIHRITDTVAGLANFSVGICRSVTDFLNTVLSSSLEDVEDLSKTMKILNPLPETPGLSQLRGQVERMAGDSTNPLRERLNNLLKVCHLMSNNPSQGLANRIQQLTSYVVRHHSEMEDLSKTPDGILILKSTLTEMLRLVTSPHPEVASASAACLGAIGPLDLQSLSFPQLLVKTSQVLAVETYTGHSYEKYCWLFHALDTSLLDKSLEVVKTAGDILKKALATTSGGHFEADYTTALRDKSFLFHYLHPFKTASNKRVVMMPPPAPRGAQTDTFKMNMDKPELWLGSREGGLAISHEAWIKNLTTTLLTTGAVRDEILSMIGPMCYIKSQFCEESLPFLVHDILEGGNAEQIQVILSNVSSFFHHHCVCSQTPDTTSAHPSCMNKQSIWTMLSVVRYLRKRISPHEKQEVPRTSWNNHFWSDIDFLEVARAALDCGANFSAVLFAEIWWDIQRNCEPKSSSSRSQSSGSSQQSQLDPLAIASSRGMGSLVLQDLLLEAYRNTGDPDGIYGCGAGKLAQPMARVQTYLHEQQNEKALTTLDIGVSHSTPSVTLLLQTVESCGADYILQWCLSNLNYIRNQQAASSSASTSTGIAAELKEFHYQAAWKLGQWDCALPAKQDKPAPFHQSLYQAMVSLKDGHLNIAKEALDLARSDAVKRLDPHVETCKSLYPFLSDLQCLTYLQQVLDLLPKLISSSCEDLLRLFAESSTQIFLNTQAVHFDQEKPLLHLMASVAKILTSMGVKQGHALEVRALWSLAVGGRKAKQYQLAEKAIYNLKSKISSEEPMVTLERVQLEEAKLFWERAEVDIAKNIVNNLIGQLSKTTTRYVKRQLIPEALCTYGNWLAETKSETPTVIIREYLEKAVALMNDSGPIPPTSGYTALEGFVSLARFADEQYQQIADHIRSPTFEDKQHLFESLRSEFKECQEFKGQSKYVKMMEKTLVLDQQEILSLQEAHGRFLLQAVLNYLKCLQSGDTFNLKVFRVVALWFENHKNPEVNSLIKESIGAIQTYKFLPLYYQLAARMSSVTRDSCSFHAVLTELMERVATDHPHHALWIIMALAHAYKDDEPLVKEQPARQRRRESVTNDQVEEERVQAAKCMMEKLRQTKKEMASIVTNMERLCLAYIELANWTVTNKTSRNPQPLQKDLAILKIAKLDNILLPSVELQVDPTGAYKNIISPVRFDPHFRVVGGINLPKIITCVGSDGKERTQLVKGQDDLRQDAVMQQVFTLVNELLDGDQEARKRQLKIQTYKVIPLSQKCGLLQWCDGTKPLGEYLIASNGAHPRYRPNDWSAKTCREHLQASGTKADNRLKAYQEICANFKPVFRHFFLENFLEPNIWFEKRLAYTRSVATNSIVGYILGLGDRHLMNILIDLRSAEVVHIDLGIAFEQGRILPTPETVPFRLTRDIVDGMGITGVEGVFRRCCEKTMEVMKNNSESLITVIQVLLYDPLSHWSLTPQQALAIQRKREQENLDILDASVAASGQVPASGQVSSSGQVAAQPGLAERDSSSRNNDSRETQNKMAERTLLRLRQKLGGQEDGVPLSVTGQVNLLIQKASDPENLSTLYAGWQPYL